MLGISGIVRGRTKRAAAQFGGGIGAEVPAEVLAVAVVSIKIGYGQDGFLPFEIAVQRILSKPCSY